MGIPSVTGKGRKDETWMENKKARGQASGGQGKRMGGSSADGMKTRNELGMKDRKKKKFVRGGGDRKTGSKPERPDSGDRAVSGRASWCVYTTRHELTRGGKG